MPARCVHTMAWPLINDPWYDYYIPAVHIPLRGCACIHKSLNSCHTDTSALVHTLSYRGVAQVYSAVENPNRRVNGITPRSPGYRQRMWVSSNTSYTHPHNLDWHVMMYHRSRHNACVSMSHTHTVHVSTHLRVA